METRPAITPEERKVRALESIATNFKIITLVATIATTFAITFSLSS